MNEINLIEKHLSEYQNENRIFNIIDIQKKSAVAEGENYTSIIERATATVILTNGRKIKKSFILKKEYEDDEKVKNDEEFSLFKNEIQVYKNVLVQFDQLMNDFQDTNDKLWCRLIGYEPYNLIIFDDLKEKNYKMADRISMLDLNHSKLVMHSLGRFHALGHVLIMNGNLKKTDLNNCVMESNSKIIVHLLAGGFNQLAKVIESNWSAEWKDTAIRLMKLEQVIVGKIQKLYQIRKDTFLTVGHGDFWTCNVMFKYCPHLENMPCAVKFIDFQDCHINTYVFDVIEFIYTSVKTEIRRTNLDTLLLVYQNSLETTLADYGLGHNAPTLNNIQTEIKRIEYFTMVSLLLSMAIVTSNVGRGFDVDNLYEDYHLINAYNPEIFNSDRYKYSVEYEIKQWIENGLL